MRRANRPVLSDDQIATLTIKSVEKKVVDDIQKLKKGLAPDECRYEAIDFVFICEGTSGEFIVRERAGAILNPDPIDSKYRGKQLTYNKLTTIVVALGLTTIETLDDDDLGNIEESLLNMAGTQVEAKLVKVDGFWRVDPSTIKPL
jgi:hypothetical protein